MKRFLLYLLVFVAAVWLGQQIHFDEGYLLLSYQQMTIEMPLWTAVVVCLLAFIVLYFILNFLRSLLGMSQRLRQWHHARKQEKSQLWTLRGLLAWLNANWSEAEKNLSRGAKGSKHAFINYLFAAKAAQAQQQLTRRDHYLKLAEQEKQQSKVTLGLIRAELQYQQGQLKQAMATLLPYEKTAATHPQRVLLLKQIYLALSDWEKLIEILPVIRRAQVLSAEDSLALETKAYYELLLQANKANQFKKSHQLWQTIPRGLQQSPALVAIYARSLVAANQANEAEVLVHHCLRHHWDESLILLYGQLHSRDLAKQLKTAEYWLNSHESDPSLLLTLGRLCSANQLWGQAREYLQASLGLKPTPAAFFELGQLHEHLGETDLALVSFRQGLSQSL